jgi:predicted component of type VI protein secretion system
MALELRIAGPGIDVTRRIEPGEPPLILGREAECSVCLPDPQRNVSRRHLSVWNEADELQFLVVSVVNGVDTPSGEVPPGGRGTLHPGQVLKIAEYAVTVETATGANLAGGDPWAALQGRGAVPETKPMPLGDAGGDGDPFGEWGFETTFGSDVPGGGGGLQASGLSIAPDIAAFYRGLGIDTDRIGVLSQGELETIGRMVRNVFLGMLELHKSVVGVREDLKSEDRTMLAPKGDKNPLKEGRLADEVALQFLFGGQSASAPGFLPPDRALRELMTELRIHEQANAAAVRAAVEGVLREFEPETLKTRLLGGGSRLFESSRAWDAYVKSYEEQTEKPGAWVQRLLDKFFTSAYLRETDRVKRDTSPRRR